MNFNRLIVSMLALLIVGWSVFAVGNRLGWFAPAEIEGEVPEFAKQDSIDTPPAASLSDALGLDEADFVEVGGIKRPKRDFDQTVLDLDAQRTRYLASLPKTGRAPAVSLDANPTVAKLGEELRENPGLHPSKSPLVAAEPFDRAAYQKDPQAYLQLTRPGRVFQSLRPGADVVAIAPLTPIYQEIVQGESVAMSVTAEPGMPVTFHTQQLGEFENRLKTISVAANDQGVARATYQAVTGVRGLVRVMAASPVHSQRVDFTVKVVLPQ